MKRKRGAAKCWSESGTCINHGACNANDGCMYEPRRLPSPSPGGDPGVLVEALELIREPGRLNYWDAERGTVGQCYGWTCGCCNRNYNKNTDDGFCNSEKCPANHARAALDSWRRSSPERTAARTAREVAHEWFGKDACAPEEGHTLFCDRIAELLEADRRQRP